ncbi:MULTISPECIES: Na+/H+ antiporter subunit D [unclassified Parafrankia]|uniref:Na+/H+ antiporter subunit D n=1 Tax=unclassified Parafrankia TaxID=2994368 RepID=UPI000DA59AAF|nr:MULTISPECIES: Na+/H+ antiporter subunit D [unclassified Parafrankia]TCJ36137.1 Na+/H+ antiporter subunit D [Parafrankia sp. BMG5.11]CAI7977827.1 multicomponent Na+:H+ antiporter subunit D [Frankia sp. Hr75.2]SQD96673.1 NADH dehydrogenase (Quinone) [Parafrankia sp. Ea1.12]
MSVLAVLPVVVPLLAAGAVLVLRGRVRAQRILALLVVAGVVADAVAIVVIADTDGPLVANLGGWPAPIGITLVADRLSGLLLLTSAVVTFAVLAYAIGQGVTEDTRRGNSSIFQSVYLVLVAGVALAYLTGDLFNLFVAFEVMLVSSYVLITLDTTPGRIRAGMTYVIVSMTSSLLFLTMLALVYAATGTMNLADLSGRVGELPEGLAGALGLLALVVFGIKAAAVPLHFWLPDSYPTAPAPVTAVLAALLTKVGVYALLRTHTLVFAHDGVWVLLLVAAVVTLLVGALGALAQDNLNRMLSYLLVSHIGYMLFGLSLFTVIGLTGVIIYMVHHIVAQAALFLASGLITRYAGTSVPRRMGGLAAAVPATAVLFALPGLSLAGIPPFSGFVAKLTLLEAGSGVGTWPVYAAVAAGLVTSLLTLYAMARVWTLAFWGSRRASVPDPEPADDLVVGTERVNRPMILATGGIVAVGLAAAVFAGPLAALSQRAADDLLEPSGYVESVLPGAVPVGLPRAVPAGAGR